MSHHLSYYDVMSDILFTVVCRQDSVMRPTLMILIQNLIEDASLQIEWNIREKNHQKHQNKKTLRQSALRTS